MIRIASASRLLPNVYATMSTCPRADRPTLEDQLPPRTPDDPGYPPLVNKRQFVPPKDLTAKPKGGR
jgi:hypothetical protein